MSWIPAISPKRPSPIMQQMRDAETVIGELLDRGVNVIGCTVTALHSMPPAVHILHTDVVLLHPLAIRPVSHSGVSMASYRGVDICWSEHP